LKDSAPASLVSSTWFSRVYFGSDLIATKVVAMCSIFDPGGNRLFSHPDLLKHAGPFLFLSIFQAGRRYLRFSLELSSSVSRSAPSRSTRAVFPAVKRAVRPGAPLLSVRALASISCSPRQRFCCQFSVCGLPCLTISSLLDFLSQGFGPRVLNVFSPARLISGLPSGARAGLRPVSHADIIFSLPIRIFVLILFGVLLFAGQISFCSD
jgi:hypothetical protein